MRLSFALVVSLRCSTRWSSPTLPPLAGDVLQVLVYLLHEIAIGLILGAITRLVTLAASVAGSVIAFQAGLSGALGADPTNGGVQGVLIGSFLVDAGCRADLCDRPPSRGADGDPRQLHDLLALRDPIMWGDAAQMAIQSTASAFVIGVQMSAPFIVLGLVFYLGMGLLGRMMPQLQVFFVAMPATIWVGLGAAGAAAHDDDGLVPHAFRERARDVPGRVSVGRSPGTVLQDRRPFAEKARRRPQEGRRGQEPGGQQLVHDRRLGPAVLDHGCADERLGSRDSLKTLLANADQFEIGGAALSIFMSNLTRHDPAGRAGAARGAGLLRHRCQPGAAPAAALGRSDHAKALQDFSRSRAPSGCSRAMRWSISSRGCSRSASWAASCSPCIWPERDRLRDDGHGRSGADPARLPGAGAQGVRRGGRGRHGHRDRRLHLSAQPLVEPAQDDGPGSARRVQADGGQPRGQGPHPRHPQ